MNTAQKTKMNPALLCVCLWLILSTPIAAREIAGLVTDRQNAPVPEADVILSARTKTISQTKTDQEGKFSFRLIPGENYILRVRAAGFAELSKPLAEDSDDFLTIILQPAAVNEDVTVSITKTESRLAETPASIVVLSRENLAQTAAPTIDDSLRQIAGFTLFRRGSSRTTNPTTQGANLRGIGGSGASRAQVLVDGISLNDAFGGWTYWTRIPKIAVEEIEVLRGGASSIYGSAALSGAINLQTSPRARPVLRFEISGGRPKTFDGSFFASFGKRGWNFDLAGQSFQTAGYILIAENERGAADTRANSRFNNGLLTIERKFNENLRIFARGNIFKERRDNGTRRTANRTSFRQAIFGADYGGTAFGAFQFRSSFEKQIYDQTFSSVSADRNSESLTRLQRVPSQAVYAELFWSKIFGPHALAAAAELRVTRGFSDETAVSGERPTAVSSAGGKERRAGFYAQDFWRAAPRLNINFGARLDDWREADALSSSRSLTNNQTLLTNFPDRRERRFSPRLGAIYQLSDRLAAFASYAGSFRAPTLNELYRSFRVGNVLTRANEELRAERAATFETGLNFSGFSKRLSVRGSLFVTGISNPVVGVTLTASPNLIVRQRQNAGRTLTRGIELDANFSPFSKLNLSAGYLLVDSSVAAFPANPLLVKKFLPQIPGQQLTVQLGYRPRRKISLSLQSRFSGAQFEDDLNTLRLRPFSVFDAFASYKIFGRVNIFAAVENIFNNRYDLSLTPDRGIAAPRFIRSGLNFNLP